VVTNWIGIMRRTKRHTFLTAGYAQASVVFPFIIVSPAYFAGTIQLGGLMQTASAFGSVQTALSYFITFYRQLAEWRSVVSRLEGFQAAVVRAQAAADASPAIVLNAGDSGDAIRIDDLLVRLPQGAPLVAADDIVISPGERVLVTGPSGAGKSTLFRAIAGVWPFGSGSVAIPKGARLMTLPQRPYFPIATLANAIAYPAEPAAFGAERIAEVVGAVGLPALASRLEEEAHWNRMLSLGEQQRLGIARALLQAPDYLFLDEATASLDEPAEAALYRLMQERLKGSTIISIGHRATLAAFHRRRLVLEREGDRSRLHGATLTPAAE
jgi:putative ATP-binding cassette transporter